MNPLVSIIIPCYNSSNYLAETLDNLKAQSYTHFECIIVDDGSTDETKIIAQEYVANDSRISYYYQENAGSAAARNLGIHFSTGEFIQFIDADDFIHPNKLKLQLEYLNSNQDVDIVYGQVVLFSSTTDVDFANVIDYNNTLTKRVSGRDEDVLKYLIKDCFMAIHAPLLRRNVLKVAGVFDSNLKSCEDYDLWFRAAVLHIKFSYYNHPETTCYYRRHLGNKSSSGSRLNYYSTLLKEKQLTVLKDRFPDFQSKLFNEIILNHKNYLFLKKNKTLADAGYTFKLAIKHKSIKLIALLIQYLIIPNSIWNLVYWNGGLINYLKIKIYNGKK